MRIKYFGAKLMVVSSAILITPVVWGGLAWEEWSATNPVAVTGVIEQPELLATPADFRPLTAGPWAVRACDGAEFDALDRAEILLQPGTRLHGRGSHRQDPHTDKYYTDSYIGRF